MQKTAGTHIAKLLAQLFDVKVVNEHNFKHNFASAFQIQQSKSKYFFWGSIRNPWDWYLSLWAFGVGKSGAVYEYLTKRYLRQTLKQLIKNPQAGFMPFWNELTKNTAIWQQLYMDANDVINFRHWLTLILQQNNYQGKAGYLQALAPQIGLMSYRYLTIHCHYPHASLKTYFNQFEQLKSFESQTCYIDYFIRQESLEEDLCHAIAQIRPLTIADKALIMTAKKSNTSFRPLAITDYYDQQSIDLVQQYDQLIIEKFNYRPPNETLVTSNR